MSLRLLLAIGIASVVAQTASAQWYYQTGAKAATVAESQARGLADIVRAQGEYNLNTARAAIDVEEARSQYIENRNRAQQVYFEMRRRNTEFRAEQAGPKPTSEQLFRFNQERAPQRLAASQLDPLTGEINWPFILTDKPYDEYREKLNMAFAMRAREGSYANVDEFRNVTGTAEAMFDELKNRIRDYPADKYIEASSFMRSLVFDAQFPSG
ncbi:hypothetical protein LOC68_19665 [Blastopirellula sp. JC732]|uniref:Uncharacterized protein n=1 Tax=Blastopirellula sediminis TaxID=2894196 RepID=A0A9X1MNN4_9BACT|nr:hypothetical protein [Blastopirellula sediminis]MCC9606083.1 hypothetical protein [Blastopirellula sediminis]MCC9630618.1 hypothetical protein [Blastopirellula sediminis]